MYDVIVIGGGAAGCVAAAEAAERGARVLIIDKNTKPARKVMITGKGRCNVTNACDNAAVMANIPSNGKFLFSALKAFSTADTVAMFEKLGVPLKTERGNRVFPISDKAADIVDALRRRYIRAGCEYICGQVITTKKVGNIFEVKCNGGQLYNSESLIIATGGASYPLTGSTGDGYAFAKSFGHSITEIRPSLVPLEIREDCCKDMQGLSLKNIKLSLYRGDKEIFSEQGEMLFTHFGVSGPLVLSASAWMRSGEADDYRISIDLKPALTEEMLDKRILRDFEDGINKNFFNALGGLLPRKMIPVFVKQSNISPHLKVNSVTREQRKRLVYLLKNFELHIKAFRPIEEAIITAGGVNLKEINPATMESKIVENLYFAGEVLDLDAYTGGFNLQIAFSTGTVAGRGGK